MALIQNRQESEAVRCFAVQKHTRRPDEVKKARHDAWNKLRVLAVEHPERILDIDPSNLDPETRKLFDRLEIIALKAQAKADADAMFSMPMPRVN